MGQLEEIAIDLEKNCNTCLEYINKLYDVFANNGLLEISVLTPNGNFIEIKL